MESDADAGALKANTQHQNPDSSTPIISSSLRSGNSSRLVDTDPNFNFALGSVIGAFIGDALGAYIEFRKDIPDPLLRETLEMRGGGCFRVGPGQVTDDSELAMCLLNGLYESESDLNLDNIAKYYKSWFCSNPFDIGRTTSNALSPYSNNLPKAKFSIQSSEQYNKQSESNGSFMRCSPLAVFCRNLSDDDIRAAVTAECSMTHSNKAVQDAEVCFVRAIVSLLRYPGDRQRAYNDAKAMARTGLIRE